jgi:hypothetical protein
MAYRLYVLWLRLNCAWVVTYIYTYGRGLGLSPSPVRAHSKTHCNSNILFHIYIIRNTRPHDYQHICHVLYGLPRQHPYGLYSQHTIFLHVCRFEQNAISISSDVRLNPNELCWVRDDEAYALVRFEVIPSTLNFEQNLIPWITPPHWKAFGPPKDYSQSI